MQIILTHTHSSMPVRHINIRPLTLILVLCILLTGSFFAGSFLAASWLPSSHVQAQLTPQPPPLHDELIRLKNTLAKSEALLSMRQEQIASMQQDMKKNQQLISSMQQNMKMFENILTARKIPGVHLLQASAHWQTAQRIAYSFVLVKGENYPRLATGSVQFSVKSPTNKILYLNDKKGKASLQYSMKTHAFLQGDIAWKKNWQPETMEIALYNKHGKQLGLGEVMIEKP